ncbi:MAG: sigma-54 dependent transcriptional regulator [Spirochaetales bacterium]|nr:sigma-54 dependent transcriptional regulator [Spirochaetales bacterium]
MSKLFSKYGASVRVAKNTTEARNELAKLKFDAVILDLNLESGNEGMEILSEIRKTEEELPVIFITGYGTIDNAVKAMKEGASDFILKPVDNVNLLNLVKKNIQFTSLKTENKYLREKINQNQKTTTYITRNQEVKNSISMLDKVKNTGESILITGESGVGKEVLAQYIHFTGNRQDKPFVSINCAALDENLLLNELFGHEKGAFTGADERKPGKFETAHDGTLFLDEIGEMSLAVQAKLLRVLEDNSFERVGGTKKISVDVRVICATNRDIEEHIKNERFRKDLYYRINVIKAHLPPIRERTEDIRPLVDFFVEYYAREYMKTIQPIGEEQYRIFERYSWPGNIRELKNVINQSVLLSENGKLHPVLPAKTEEECTNGKETQRFLEEQETQKDELQNISSLADEIKKITSYHERRIIKSALYASGGNKSETSRKLNITRKTLQSKIDKYNL